MIIDTSEVFVRCRSDTGMEFVGYDDLRVDGNRIYASVLYRRDGALIALHYTLLLRHGEYFIDKTSITEAYIEHGVFHYGDDAEDDVCAIDEDIRYFERTLTENGVALLA